MGNSNSTEVDLYLNSAIEHKPKILISPSESYAKICKGQSIWSMYPEIVRSVDKVKKQ